MQPAQLRLQHLDLAAVQRPELVRAHDLPQQAGEFIVVLAVVERAEHGGHLLGQRRDAVAALGLVPSDQADFSESA
ncbi:hypothetical protein LP416_13715 [Polaromonas sp. P2-4]|nr:hypothetical protein LP416_13715 [Polaromonas sp. P2-4]